MSRPAPPFPLLAPAAAASNPPSQTSTTGSLLATEEDAQNISTIAPTSASTEETIENAPTALRTECIVIE